MRIMQANTASVQYPQL